jgi:hypothetical protein
MKGFMSVLSWRPASITKETNVQYASSDFFIDAEREISTYANKVKYKPLLTEIE